MCPMIYYENIKARREDLLREAEKERLIKIAQAGQPSLSDRFQTKMGQLLKRSAERFQDSPTQGYLKN